MGTDFKASNGWHTNGDGHLRGSFGELMFLDNNVAHARQFFQELRDHELGRWRDTEDSNFVCYPAGPDGVMVFDEPSGTCWLSRRDTLGDFTADKVAKRFFAAHPQHKPLPTEPGLYVHARDAREFPHSTVVLVHLSGGSWYEYGEAQRAANAVAQAWHDAGQLVRLVPVESEGDNE